jgi:site-specific DNA-cytosine methylase
MKKTIVVVSTFDGISVALLALRWRYPNRKIIYYVIEIDKKAMMISRHNHPDNDLLSVRYLGDIRNVTRDMIPEHVDIFVGGSPCQSFSIAGKQEGFDGKSGLFWEYVRLKKELNPTYFLLENVGMKQAWQNIISAALGRKPLLINSSLLSAQFRKRLYWTNIPDVTIPEDRGITIPDIVQGGFSGAGKRNRFKGDYYPNGRKKWNDGWMTIRKDHKSNCLTRSGGCDKVKLINGDIRALTIEEKERLQTLPVGYTNVPGLCKTARSEAIGNSWTLEVIKHIFSFLPN